MLALSVRGCFIVPYLSKKIEFANLLLDGGKEIKKK